MNDKLSTIRKLILSPTYVLVTDKETIMYVNLGSLAVVEQLYALKRVHKNLAASIKDFEDAMKAGDSDER